MLVAVLMALVAALLMTATIVHPLRRASLPQLLPSGAGSPSSWPRDGLPQAHAAAPLAAQSGGPVAIALGELIPVARIPVPMIALPPPAVGIQQMLNIVPVPSADWMHPMALLAAETTESCHPWEACGGKLAVYTDGSAGGGSAAWAAVVLAVAPSGRQRLAGAAAGIIDDEAARRFGITERDNIAAECIAALYALAIVWAAGATQAVLNYDCTLVGGIMDETMGVRPLPLVASLMRALTTVIGANADLSHRHVAAHTMHPWNEMADSIAGAVRRGLISPPAASFPFVAWCDMQPDDIDWATGLWSASRDVLADVPRAPDGALIVADSPGSHGPAASWVREQISRPRELARVRPRGLGRERPGIMLRLASANVLTLKPAEMRAAGHEPIPESSARACLLQKAVRDAGMLMIGVQEARTPQGMRIGGGFVTIAGGPSAGGHHGCELWISTELEYAPGQRARHTDVLMTAASPRHLLVAVRARMLHVDVLVAHAPCTKHSRDDVAAWWKQITREVSARQRAVPLICMIDANARVGGRVSEAIGDAGAQPEDFAGECLHRFAVANRLFLPATMRSWHDGGQHHTWTGSAGVQHRIDYVLLPAGFCPTGSATVRADIDLATAKDDHYLVQVDACWTSPSSARAPVRRRPQVMDRAALDDPAARQIFIRELSRVQVCPWAMHAQEHWQHIETAIQRAMAVAFPPGPPKPRKDYLSDATWRIVVARGAHRLELRRQARRLPRLWCSAVLRSWARLAACRAALPDAAAELDGHLALERRARATAMAALESSAAALKTALRADRRLHAEALARSAADAEERRDTAAIYQIARALQPRARRPAPAVRLTDGGLATSPEQARGRWREHFEGILSAGTLTEQQVAQLNLDGCPVRPVRDALRMEHAVAPSLHQLVRMHSAARPRKAFGEDLMPNELFRAFPRELARLLLPIYWKAAFRLEEPIQWKGGPMVELLKNKLKVHTADCDDFRGVLVTSGSGKRWHKHLRTSLQPHLDGAAADTMCGGLAGRGTDVAAHTLRVAFDLASTRRRSIGIFFCDIIAAFYEMAREVVLGTVESDEDIARIFKSVGYNPDEMRGFIARVRGGGVLRHAGVPGHLAAAVGEAHRGSWFPTEGLMGVSRSRRGSLPGDPLGDVVFNFLMADVLSEATSVARQDGIVATAAPPAWGSMYLRQGSETAGSVELFDTSYVDDAAFMVMAETPSGVLEGLGSVVKCIHAVFRARGLRLNFASGKSEIVCFMRGAGKAGALDALERDGGLVVDLGPQHSVLVQRPPLYRHLGGMVDPAGSMAPEAVHRAMMTVAAMKSAPKRMLADPALAVATRAAMASALYCSRLFYNAAVWSSMSARPSSTIASAYGKIMRLVVKPRTRTAPRHASDAEVMKVLSWPDAATRIRTARLRYLPRLLLRAPAALRAILAEHEAKGTSWAALILEDLRWVRRTCGAFRHFSDPAVDASQWREYVLARPKAWRSMIARLVSAASVAAARARGRGRAARAGVTDRLLRVSLHRVPTSVRGEVGTGHSHVQVPRPQEPRSQARHHHALPCLPRAVPCA